MRNQDALKKPRRRFLAGRDLDHLCLMSLFLVSLVGRWKCWHLEFRVQCSEFMASWNRNQVLFSSRAIETTCKHDTTGRSPNLRSDPAMLAADVAGMTGAMMHLGRKPFVASLSGSISGRGQGAVTQASLVSGSWACVAVSGTVRPFPDPPMRGGELSWIKSGLVS